MCHSIHAHLHYQVRSICCHHLQHGCQLHCHTADSVLTSEHPFFSQQICIKAFITLAILGMGFKMEKLNARTRSIHIHISGWNSFYFRTTNSLTVRRRHWWCSGQMWCQFWYWLPELVRWRCIHGFAPTAYLGIQCCAILAWKAAIHLISLNHRQVSFHGGHHNIMPKTLNTPNYLLFDFVLRIIDETSGLLYCDM